jgi:hypothetical protein
VLFDHKTAQVETCATKATQTKPPAAEKWPVVFNLDQLSTVEYPPAKLQKMFAL